MDWRAVGTGLVVFVAAVVTIVGMVLVFDAVDRDKVTRCSSSWDRVALRWDVVCTIN